MKTPRSILVLRFSSIGDIVLATSPLRHLRSAFTAARIDFMTLTEYTPLLEGHPALDRLLNINRSVGYWGLRGVGRRLNSNGYDLVVDLHNTLRAKIIRSQMRSVPALVYQKPYWQRFLLFRLNRNTFPADYNILKALNDVLSPIDRGITPVPPNELFISAIEIESASNYLHEKNILKPYACLIPGAAWPQKRWMPERYAEIAQNIIDTFALDVVLLGTSEDDICDEIARYCPSVNNLKGLTSLRRSMAIISFAKMAIGNDTGLIHIAEALGVNSIMILGPTAVETGAGHNRPGSSTLAINLSCRPCSQNGKRPCYRKEQYCLTQITPEMVFKQVRKIYTA